MPFQESSITSTNIALAEVTREGTLEYTPGVTLEATAVLTPTVYLPLVNQKTDKFLGVYFEQYWTSQTVDEFMTPADRQTGKMHTSVGWFIDLQNIAFTPRQNDLNINNFYRQLEALWDNGYISFVNLGSALQISDYDVPDNCPIAFNSSQVISGECDPAIQRMADLYLQWVSLGGGRRAMIAPLQEMNGIWTSYGKDPNTSAQFKEAYRHILSIFADKGITRDQVWWVFAPNGYSNPGDDARKFENYYPGDDVVDIVGFSSYNYGYCPDINPNYWRWESYSEIFEPYIARMQVMAASKPIIIAETASTAYYHDESGNPRYDIDAMNQWLIENYNYFASRSGVIGIYYFSFHEFGGLGGCEIELNPNGEILSGYVTAASNPIYQYLTVEKLDTIIP
jgi:Glycosyl hydrolase family 26